MKRLLIANRCSSLRCPFTWCHAQGLDGACHHRSTAHALFGCWRSSPRGLIKGELVRMCLSRTYFSIFVTALASFIYSPVEVRAQEELPSWAPASRIVPEDVETSPAARFSWMLPRTVIDATVVYTFQGCADDGTLKVKIQPTLVPRAAPDTYVKRRGIDTGSLTSFWNDSSISAQTFAGSQILNSIGSSPASQVSQIAGNILGGITKLVGIGIGLEASMSGSPPPNCKKTAVDDQKDIVTNKKDINKLQQSLAAGTKLDGTPLDEPTQKEYTSQIEAKQNLISTLQKKLTITIKKTIDAGFSPVDINVATSVPNRSPVAIETTGIIARFDLTKDQLGKWLDNPESLSSDQKSLLRVNVYLDFPNAYVPIAPKPIPGNKEGYLQEEVPKGYIYRAVSYIPVLVWLGDGFATVTFTNGSADISWPNNHLTINEPVYFTTTGSLPRNFTVKTTYYVKSVTGTDTIQVAATPQGPAVTAGSAASGTQTGARVASVQPPDDDAGYDDLGDVATPVERPEPPKPPTPKPPMQLSQPQRIAFAQYGVKQTLPLSPEVFQTLTWSVTFLDNGEVTSANFTSKASGVNASAFLGTVASTANSIVTQQLAATSPESQAVALQGQADLIYQSRRLALCQSNPANCPSK